MGLLSKLLGVDPKFRAPRVWSNEEIRKLGQVLEGSVVNVSGWKDEDKEGRRYRDYFHKATEYVVTNYSSAHKGFQGVQGELALDLLADLDQKLLSRFDVVFNHTTLEHVFEVDKAFGNLARMARKHLLIVVPFMQEQHGPEYGDYWRFTPLAVRKLMEKNGLVLEYINFNDTSRDAIYIVAVGSKNGAVLPSIDGNKVEIIDRMFLGTRIIRRRIFGIPIR